ncbi:MAG: DUF3618 domain-containing protein [Acetobacteraceae bacterium]|nr:DUF3618 domain-containing protein [Acetobacteraceae bacterium]
MSTTTTTDPGSRSAAEIERDVERTRAGLTNTLEELRDKASPGQLLEQAVDWARSSGGSDMMRNLGAQVRDNPLPLLLVGAGIGWLMLSGGNERRDDGRQAARVPALPPPAPVHGSTRVRAYPADAMPQHGGPPVGDSITSAARSLADSIGSAAGSAAEAAGSAWEGVKDAATSAIEGARDTAAAAAGTVSDTARALRDRAGQHAAGAGEGARWLAQEQPLILGAIGVALGAAVGALLPGTETEDRLMGEARDSVVDRAGEVAQRGYERLKDTAGEHLDRAREASGETVGEVGSAVGLSRAGEALGEAAREVRHAVRDAARDIAGEAKSAIGAADDGKPGPATQPGPQRA